MKPAARGVLFALALAAFASTAAAAPAVGDLAIRGAFILPEGAEANGKAVAAIAHGDLSDATVTADRLSVTIWTQTFLVVGEAEIAFPAQPRSYAITHATAAQVASGFAYAYVGLRSEGAALTIRAENQTSTTNPAVATLGAGGQGSSDRDLPQAYWFFHEQQGPQAFVDATGAMTACGARTLKLHGFDVAIQGAENRTAEVVKTGRFQDDPTRARYVTVYLESPDACVSVNSSAIQATMPAASFAWQGRALARAVSGTIQTDSTIYSATGADAYLDGALSARFAPDAPGRAQLSVDGDLSDTNLASAPISPQPLRIAGEAGSVLVAVVGLAAAGAAGVYAWTHRPSRFSRAECLSRAHAAMEADEFEGAILWLTRARRFGLPADELADLAYAMAALGRAKKAEPIFLEAHEAGASGDIALSASFFLREQGASDEKVFEWLERAFDRSPELISELDGKMFAPFEKNPRWRRIVEAARERIGNPDEDF